jgi:hypothetical protein
MLQESLVMLFSYLVVILVEFGPAVLLIGRWALLPAE